MRFELLDGAAEELTEGHLLVYRVRLAPGLWAPWVSEIKRVKPGRCFADDQRVGPFAFWHHTHELEETGTGTRVRDILRYHVGRGPLGRVAHRLAVDPKIDAIFAHRRRALEQRFGSYP